MVRLPGSRSSGSRGGIWAKWRVSMKFLRSLFDEFGGESFTNRDAYDLYEAKHTSATQPDLMLDMNVRNHLCAAATHGVLERLGPGVYRFPETTSEESLRTSGAIEASKRRIAEAFRSSDPDFYGETFEGLPEAIEFYQHHQDFLDEYTTRG